MKRWMLLWLMATASAMASEMPPAAEPISEPPSDASSEESDSEEAATKADPASGKVPGQRLVALTDSELLAFRPRLRAGRTTTWVSWGMISAGTVAIPLAAALKTYRPPPEWYDVWKYNRSFLARSAASGPLYGVGAGLMGGGVIVQTAGVMVEARALARITGQKPIVGWVGTGLISGSLALGGAFAWTPIVALQFSPIFLAGWGCIIGQWVINMRIENSLDPATRQLLLPKRPGVEVVVLPTIGKAPGLSVVGRF